MKNADMPAMPCEVPDTDIDQYLTCSGLTKREQLAAMAMQGLLSHVYGNDPKLYEVMAGRAVMCADALLNELDEG